MEKLSLRFREHKMVRFEMSKAKKQMVQENDVGLEKNEC
jgi:hypothetical protein